MWRALALAVMMVAGGARAQLNPSLSEAERGIRAGGPAAEARRLRITDLAVEADIVGRTAAVTLSLTVQTDAEAPYEADLTLRLPAGAVVTGYALDVGGRMIPGQLIEAPRAREAYEREVRGRVDPGLAEVTGERFATRVYPIDRLHPRKITVSFAAPFDPATGLVLPLARDAAIDRFAARVGIAGYATPPIVRIAGDAVTLASEGGRLVGSVAATGRALREGLSVAGGTPADTGAVARHANGRRFFVAEGASPPAAAPARGSRLRVYWDRSRSHRDGAIDAEIDALVRLVDTLAPTGIDVVTFASDRPQVAAVADAAGLRALLGRVVYRGGSSLAGLDALKLPAAGRCVLVFDGRVTIDRAAAFRPDCAPSALTGARDADAARLARLVRPGGGAVVRVGSADAAAAAAALAEGGGAVRAVSDASGTAIDYHVLPAAAGRWLIVGEAPTDGALHLTLRDGSRRVLRLATEVSGDAPGALLAVNRIADLADDPADHQRMLATARAFGIAGPGLSLLVLESPDQYLRARLAPPAGFDEAWMADYAEQRAQQRRDEADAKGERLERVLAAWADRRAWWAKRYPTGARPAKRRGESGPPGEAPPPPPPPAPAPPPLVAVPSAPGIAAEPAESDAGDVVVTAALRRPRPPAARSGIEIELAPPPTDRPYLAALGTATPARRAAVLAEQERAYGTTPAFYLDAAEWFRARGDAGLADLLLMSALDLATADDETRRIVAFRLERDGRHDRAVELAEALAVGDADSRPQPRRDLALALAARGRAAGPAGRADLERAFALLTEVVLEPAGRAFDGLEVVALEEANALVSALDAVGGRWTLDPRLRGALDLDARIVIGWTADDADIDLWVDEPNGERVFYGNKLGASGGTITDDMTDGYGPEEYAIRRAPRGSYSVRVNGFDADRLNPNGAGHVLVRLFRNFARDGERQVMVDADLSFQTGANRDNGGEARDVATLKVE